MTAGNSSPLNDGASMTLIGDERAGRLLGREPLARIVAMGAHGVDPDVFGIAPVEAANVALARAGIGWGDVAVVELNEAFASQSLACPQAQSQPKRHKKTKKNQKKKKKIKAIILIERSRGDRDEKIIMFVEEIYEV